MKWFFTILCSAFIGISQAQISDFEHIDFTKADAIATAYKGADLDNLPVLVHQLTNSLETDVERFRAIYYWVCHNVKNDYNMLLKNERKLKKYQYQPSDLASWKAMFQKEFFEKLLNRKRTICTGYAYLIEEMASLAGISCKMIHGYGKTNTISFEELDAPNHSWNAVQLSGKWYLCDPTWSSGIIDASTYEFHFDFREQYFLMAPEEFAERHRPALQEWSLISPEETESSSPSVLATTSSTAGSQQ